jgi:hypothetical protein
MSRILGALWQVDVTAKHRDRLAKIRSRVDNQRPVEYKHMTTRAKKEQAKETQLANIDRENHLLLDRMEDIKERKMTMMDNSSIKNVPASLRGYHRRKHDEQIARENRVIAARLMKAKGHINRSDLDAFGKQYTQNLKNLSNKQTRRIVKRIQSDKDLLKSPEYRRAAFKKGSKVIQPTHKKKKKVKKITNKPTEKQHESWAPSKEKEEVDEQQQQQQTSAEQEEEAEPAAVVDQTAETNQTETETLPPPSNSSNETTPDVNA